MKSHTTRPSGEPGPVEIEYDHRGGRKRKWFASGVTRPAWTFFRAKYKAGKNPKVYKASNGLYDPAFAPSQRPAVSLRECQVECCPGFAHVTLAGGLVLLLTADDLERLGFLVRDEPDPTVKAEQRPEEVLRREAEEQARRTGG